MIVALAARLLGPKLAWLGKPLVYGLAVLAIVLALWAYGAARYRAGVHDERAAWELKAERMKAVAEAQQRQADELRRQAERLHQATITRNRQEVDDAIRDIPDQGTSARQRARACLELRRQGKTSPACEPQPAR